MSRRKLYFTLVVVGLLTLSVLCCGGKYLISRRMDRHRQREQVKLEDGKERCFVFDTPRRIPVGDKQKATLQLLFGTLAEAYSNGEHSVIAKWRDVLPPMVECIPDRDFAQATSGFYGAVSRGLSSANASLCNPGSLPEFSARVKTDLEAVRLYGNICVRRRSGGDLACRLEALALKRLNRCRSLFAAEGRSEFRDAADAFIAEWIEHIESPQGLARTEALHWMAFSTVWGRDAYGYRQEWPYLRDKAISQGARYLIQIGYEPDWIGALKRMPNDYQLISSEIIGREKQP